ncbi:type IV pilus modification PilV family protein [Nitratifractor sp.]
MFLNDKRQGVALIELIFAIVVIAIALMSAPTLIATSAKSASIALQQEGINEAASRISMILTYPWDQNDTMDTCIPPVLHVTQGDSELEEASANRRIGVPLQSNSHTFVCNGKKYNASAIAVDGMDDIDDFIGNDTLQFVNVGSGGVDYIEKTTVNMQTNVMYISDIANYDANTTTYIPNSTLSGTSNIKKITVTLTSTSGKSALNKNIVLKAFSCNVGGYEYIHQVLR